MFKRRKCAVTVLNLLLKWLMSNPILSTCFILYYKNSETF